MLYLFMINAIWFTWKKLLSSFYRNFKNRGCRSAMEGIAINTKSQFAIIFIKPL